MENFLTPDVAVNYKFLSFSSNVAYGIYGSLLVIFAAFIVFLLSIIYKKARRKFPLKVNCWFCNSNTTVPYELSNSWDCPHCKQYNGFSKEGDYNKIIPEQFNYKLNEDISKIIRASVKSSEGTIHANGFCKLCNINQQLKIQQLSLFVPLNENNYYEEIEQYRKKLEKAYQLCSKCENTLQRTLEKQRYNLLQNQLNSHKTKAFLEKPKQLFVFDGNNILVIIKKNGISGLKVVLNVLAIFLCLALIIDFETEHQYLNLSLPNFNTSNFLLDILKVLWLLKEKICHLKKELSLTGFLCSFLLLFENPKKKNYLNLFAWGFLYISLWSTFDRVQLILSGICLYLNTHKTQNGFKHYTNKSGFKSVRKVFPEIYNNNLVEESEPISKMPSPLFKSDSVSSLEEWTSLSENSKIKEKKEKLNNVSSFEEKKKSTKSENEIESFPNEDKEMTSTKSIPNLTFNQKSFQEAEQSSLESNGTYNEVFSHLSSLQLGGKPKKPNKPPNFLFANHNFSDLKHSYSIIKPAKFIKNFNSTSWTETNECNSRSSTPSSGYSSQKPENMDQNRSDFPKTMTPVFMNSFGRQGSGNYFDCYDGNQGHYSNVNCFSPGVVPFHKYSGPFGQTAFFACSRPTNFPFFFPSWQGYSGQKFSPSSRFSDASDFDNIFQESSKRFEKNQKWCKFKAVLYYFSIFLNFITMVSLAYFISTGIILVDWKLPKFNFFM